MRLIDADALKKVFHAEWDGVLVWDEGGETTADEFCNLVDAAPTIEAEPVKRGCWKDVFCSVCGEEAITEWNDTGGEHIFSSYCPNCGAKMEPISASSENGQEGSR